MKLQCKIYILIFKNSGVLALVVVYLIYKVIDVKDIRISIRLTKEEHIKFKTIAIKKQLSMQDLLKKYVLMEIQKEEVEENEQKN